MILARVVRVLGQSDLAERPAGLDADHRIVGVADAAQDDGACAAIAQVAQASDDGRPDRHRLATLLELGDHDSHRLIFLHLIFVERR